MKAINRFVRTVWQKLGLLAALVLAARWPVARPSFHSGHIRTKSVFVPTDACNAILALLLLLSMFGLSGGDASAAGTYPSQLVRLPFDTPENGGFYYITQAPQQAQCRDFPAPLSHFEGDRNKANERAIDIGMAGGTEIYAAGEGTVQQEGYEDGIGSAITVRIKHDSGDLVTWYVHLSSTTVNVGQRVYPWTVIGYSGDTGTPGAYHLHFAATIDNGGSPWYDSTSVDIRGHHAFNWYQQPEDWNSAGFSNCRAASVNWRDDGTTTGSPHMTEASASPPKAKSTSGSDVPWEVGLFPDDDNPTDRTQAYRDAYAESEKEGMLPGQPIGRVHNWAGVQLQDFSGGNKGDGWGVLAWDQKNGRVYYIGGGTWAAYKHAVYEKSVLGGGIDPGYPTSAEVERGGVRLQFFEGGSWGNGAIIGGDNAWLVTGKHWEKYWEIKGWDALGRPHGPVYLNGAGKYQQDFDKGNITELDGKTSVEYRQSGGGGWNVQLLPTTAPIPAPIAPLIIDPVPTLATSMTCNDTGNPFMTSRLTASPQNPDTATEVTLSVTVTNNGCGTFAPEVMAIGGRDPSGNVADPYQSRQFTLAPGESKTLTQSVVLSAAGTHEFFMAYLRVNGGWHRIPDTSGDSTSIFVNVNQAAEVSAPDTSAVPPPDSTEDESASAIESDEGAADTPVQEPQVEPPPDTTVEESQSALIEPAGNAAEAPTQAQSTGNTSDVAVVATENGNPIYDACFILLEYGNEGCDENQDGKITYEDVPTGTYTLRQTRNLGSGRSVPDSTITVTGTPDADGWERMYVSVVRSSTNAIEPVDIEPDGVVPAANESVAIAPSNGVGNVDIALITRDPGDGHLLTGACYVLVNYSNEGCDENGDGQVTFARIPPGTYTVRQTQTPAGYPTINDLEISVAGTGYMEGPSSAVPLGFVVKQAPDQNAPNTRNVSVVFLDMSTHERVATGACVQLVGASNVGCDEDLVDGQVDFLDVPAGGPYELSFSNLPSGYEVATVGGPVALTIDAGATTPPTKIVFVLLAGASGSGSNTIEPTNSGSSNDQQVSTRTSSTGNATVLMIMRGCPEWFNPNADDFFANCTIPLDAPDASVLYHGGDGQGGMNIMGMDRNYNGAYVFQAGPYTMNLQLSGLAPVVRDGYTVIGADSVAGETYTVNLSDGENREIWVFYYYD